MDTKTLLVNFVTTFVAAFLAIALFAAIQRPPQPQMPEHMPPMPPSAAQPGPAPHEIAPRPATKVGTVPSQTAAPVKAPAGEKAPEPAKK